MDTQPAAPEYVKDLDFSTRSEICKMLNIQLQLGGDYRTLAGLLNMSVINIETISAKENPANEVLKHWQTKIYDATIPRLRELLLDKKMKRNDIVDVLDKRRAAVHEAETPSHSEDEATNKTTGHQAEKPFHPKDEAPSNTTTFYFCRLLDALTCCNCCISVHEAEKPSHSEDEATNKTTGHQAEKPFHPKDEAPSNTTKSPEMDTQPVAPEYVKDLDVSTRSEICKMLNIPRQLGGDYRTLAGLLNMSVIDKDTISAKENPANEVLKHWETKIYDATIPRLRELLLDKKMERNDIVDVLDKRRAAVHEAETPSHSEDEATNKTTGHQAEKPFHPKDEAPSNTTTEIIRHKRIADCSSLIGMITLKNISDDQLIYNGTGWIVAREGDAVYVMTNNHVINNIKQRERNDTKRVIQFNYLTNAQPKCPEFQVPEKVLCSNEDLDYAILKINFPCPNGEYLKINPKLPKLDCKVSVIGHSNGKSKKDMPGKVLHTVEGLKEFVVNKAKEYCAPKNCDSSNKESVCYHNYNWKKFKDRQHFLIPHNCGTSNGASGSPLVNDNADVLAIHSWGMFLGNKQQQEKPAIEFAHAIKFIMDDIKEKDPSLAKILKNH